MSDDILKMIKSIADFASIYCFSKCMKTLLCGLCLIPVLLVVHRILRKKSAILCCYLWTLLVPMAFMGMSKLFYQRYFVYVTAYLAKYTKAWHGYLYFGVMFALFMVFIIKNIYFRRTLKRMSQIYDTSVINERVKIYVSDINASPFSGGIIRPYIVAPRDVWERLDQKSRDVVIRHELAHINLGHIVLLTVFRFLTYIWWINPLIYLCERMLKEDIEHACDEYTIADAGITKHAYGCVLIGLAEHFCQNTNIAVASFIEQNDFRALKERIQYIGAGKADKNEVIFQKRVGIALALASVLLLSAGIAMTSYSRYTVLEEIYVYGEDMRQIACDTAAVNEAFRVEDKKLYIDAEGFERFLQEEQVSDEYVYVSFGTVMKLPGFGGCGDVVLVDVAGTGDTDDVLYLSSDTIENRLAEIFLKYII
ncbi:MAG: M56 family metallopeptidase [Lachnospiraceae bacterium]|nr:M56 family metallopeptidase [Lachnospiraceae bacterium]